MDIILWLSIDNICYNIFKLLHSSRQNFQRLAATYNLKRSLCKNNADKNQSD